MKQTKSWTDSKIIPLCLMFFGITQFNCPVASQTNYLSSDYRPSKTKVKPEKTELLLYCGYRTRSPLVQWYIEELAISYKYISLDIRAQEQRKPEFLAINPMGKVPAIVDGEFKLW